ncbi:MAG TPA: NAD+ synthase [Gaiellaceae bacterium]|nr:NAD+ synthase [Gaiellaceae bacterium]
MRLALAQTNSVVGDIDGNAARVVERIEAARAQGADVVLLPELMVTGYPAEDLLLRPGFVRAARRAVDEIARTTQGIVALVGTPLFENGALYNACFVLADGAVQDVYRKHHLPNYGVFDEDRYFEPGNDRVLLDIAGVRVGVTICEDIWITGPPSSELGGAGAQLVANISASPFHVGKAAEREEIVRRCAAANGTPVALCNMVGAQDELVFDGHSVVIGADGEVLARAAGFEEDLLVVDWPELRGPVAPELGDLEQMRLALEVGVRDYVEKNGFGDVVVSVSGGIDSALVAALCVEALGAERVHGVTLPSKYSSEGTRSDAWGLAESLGIDFREIAIEPIVESFTEGLAEAFAGRNADLTEENLQARIRGTILMALSNKFGWLVIASGNKSELSVGYSTLYGDLAGGFALIKDVFKTDVFRLSRHLNARAGRELIPASIIERAPSAELRADQLDEDSLPPYPVLDKVLEAYVELDRSREELVGEDGFDADVVDRALGMIDRAEYKRRQAPPGVKLRPKAFGRDRRTPITNRWPG